MKQIIINVIALSVIGTFVVIFSFQSFLTVYFESDEQCLDMVLIKDFDTPETNPELVLLWEKERLLEWSDFKGEPVNADKFNACTVTWIRPTFTITHVGEPIDLSERYFYLKNFKTEAYFFIYDSWVNPRAIEDNIEKEKILKHEQGHFDITEDYAQKYTQTLNTQLLGKEFPENGTTTSERYSNARKIAGQMVNNITEILDDEWRKSIWVYDDDTDGGLNISIQNVYDEHFDKLRNEP